MGHDPTVLCVPMNEMLTTKSGPRDANDDPAAAAGANDANSTAPQGEEVPHQASDRVAEKRDVMTGEGDAPAAAAATSHDDEDDIDRENLSDFWILAD